MNAQPSELTGIILEEIKANAGIANVNIVIAPSDIT